MRATVDVAENSGDAEQIHLPVGEQEIIGLANSSHRARRGDVLDLQVQHHRVCMLNDASGLSLASRRLAAAQGGLHIPVDDD